ncbi:proteoglycan 4-like [Pollicipes pollicipes]|uniref:proteoglycan 4-like n=1 Tax=Pollicipes pollicipes TaxID=41117 RepID=UPI001884AE7C|nr:proteoglycan 4-like [Pollicipes pollicipes]
MLPRALVCTVTLLVEGLCWTATAQQAEWDLVVAFSGAKEEFSPDAPCYVPGPRHALSQLQRVTGSSPPSLTVCTCRCRRHADQRFAVFVPVGSGRGCYCTDSIKKVGFAATSNATCADPSLNVRLVMETGSPAAKKLACSAANAKAPDISVKVPLRANRNPEMSKANDSSESSSPGEATATSINVKTLQPVSSQQSGSTITNVRVTTSAEATATASTKRPAEGISSNDTVTTETSSSAMQETGAQVSSEAHVVATASEANSTSNSSATMSNPAVDGETLTTKSAQLNTTAVAPPVERTTNQSSASSSTSPLSAENASANASAANDVRRNGTATPSPPAEVAANSTESVPVTQPMVAAASARDDSSKEPAAGASTAAVRRVETMAAAAQTSAHDQGKTAAVQQKTSNGPGPAAHKPSPLARLERLLTSRKLILAPKSAPQAPRPPVPNAGRDTVRQLTPGGLPANFKLPPPTTGLQLLGVSEGGSSVRQSGPHGQQLLTQSQRLGLDV